MGRLLVLRTQRGIVLTLLLGSSLATLGQGASEKRGGPDESDNPSKRARWFLRGRTVNGKSAADLLRRAHQQKLQIRQQTAERMERAAAQASQSSPGSSATAPAGGVVPMTVPAGSAWVNLGPAPITSLGRFGDASGRIPAIAVDQNDSTGNTVYVGGAYGGVWKSTNAANANPSLVTWTPIYDNDPAAATLAVGAISLQPNNSSVILVGTGEPNGALDSYYGMGILRSTNGGASWVLITSGNSGANPFKGMGVSKFAWKPDGSVVVAGLSNATNLGPGAGGGFQGIYYSTDAGATWTRATNATPGDTVFGSVSDVVYNATLGKFFATLRKQGVYSSTNGSSWTRLTNQPVTFAANCSNGGAPNCDMLRGQLTVRPGSAEMYAWIVSTDATTTNRGISRTTSDDTMAWTVMTVTGINSCGDTAGCGTGQGFYDLVLTAVPNGLTNTDLYAGAVNLFKCANSNSTTCATWLNLTHVYGSCNGANVSVHPDQHAIEFLVADPNKVYFGNDGGAYRTLTSLTGMGVGTCNTAPHNAFDDLNTSSLGSLTQFISISHHPTDDSVILGGTQDNGSPAIASGQASPPLNPPLWYEANGGDGGFNEIDQTNPNNWYTAFTDVTIQRCTTGTSCIETDFFSAAINNDSTAGTVNFPDHGDFYTPYILDPQLSSRIIIGTCRVWRGNADGTGFAKSGGSSFNNALSNKLLLAGGTTACSASEAAYVSSLAAGGPLSAGNGSQVIYAGTNDGHIWVTTNATTGIATWTDRTGSTNPSAFVVSGLAIDTTDATGQTAYMTIMGFTGGGGHVFKTTNAGAGWTDISAGLPDAPADSVVIDPIDHTIIYVGTDVGVFATNDNGATWSEFGTGLPNVATVALRTFNSGGTKKLRVGTHGRGVWETDLASGLPALTAVSVTPSSGTGTSQTFSFLFSDADGVGRITYAQALINAANSWPNACAILYIQNGTQLYLVNDAGNGWQGPLTPGVAGTLQNNQCTLDAGASSVSAVGNNLTVNAALSFKPAFGGDKIVLLDAEDTVNHLSSGFQSLGTWTVPAAPTAVSVTPSSGTGSSQTFSFLFSDAGGVGRITYAQALINSANSWPNACAILYIQNGTQLYLVNDAGNGWQGPLTPGVAGTLQNNQCTLDAGASSVSAVGNNLTVNAALSFKPAFGGDKVVLLDAEDTVNHLSSGFQSLGTWTVSTSAPSAVSVTPSSGTGSSQTFSFLYSDAGGVGRITYAQALINTANSWPNACAILYIQNGTQLYLVNDVGNGWQGPLTPGVAGTLQNNQCTLDAGASSVSAVGNNLTVNAALSFKPAFSGSKVVLLDAEDTVNHLSSGFQSLGTWTVSTSAPTAVSVTPSSGTGSSQTFSFLYSDAGGVGRITYAQALINAANSWPNACAILYIQNGTQLYLVNDAGNGWQGPLTPGVAGTLQNNQCTLDAGASSVSAVGNNLTVNAALSFKPAFGGSKIVLLDAEDIPGNLSSGFQNLGTWTVPASAPTAVSVTPSSGTGSSQTFSFLYSDAGGVGRITYAQALINAANSWPNACAILYIQNGTQLYLVNDAGNGWQGPLTPGVAGTLQNNQCTLDAGASSVSAVGNNLTVNAALSFKPAFSGSKIVLLDAEDIPGNLSSGFQSLGTWTVPAAAPTAVSVTPSSGTGTSQTFSFLYSDAGGVGRITYAQALINAANSWPSACAILYIQNGTQLYLVNDVGNGWQGPLTPGVAGTLQNNQCTLDAGASSVSAVGNNLTVNAALSFKPAFGGSKIVLLDAEDIPGHLSSGFQSLGTWTVPAAAPTAVSVTPSSGTGTSQTFSFLFSDADGVGRITYAQALINAANSWPSACAILYIQNGTQLYLVNDAGNGWQGPLTPGVAGTLQNSQCTLDAGASSVSAVGNNLTVNAALSFKPAFGGNKIVLLDAEDTVNHLSSGFQSLGTWTVP